MLVKIRDPRYKNKVYFTRNGVWVQGEGSVDKKNNVLVVLDDELHLGSNIVTTAGRLYYAQRAASESCANFVNGSNVFDGVMVLATAHSGSPAIGDNYSVLTVQSGSEKAITSTWPKTNDGDSANTGAGVNVVSYKYSYVSGDGNWTTNLTHGAITNPTPGGTEALLCVFAFAAPFTKPTGSAATVYVNHTSTSS